MALPMTAEDPLKALDAHADAARIRSKKLVGDVVTIVADASGLSDPERSELEARLKAAAGSLPGIREARVALTASKPGRTYIAIGSGKGGVGKSTLTANLAIALAKCGGRVGLIDADIYGPNVPIMLGMKTQLITDLEIAYTVFDSVKLSIGANNLFNEYPDKLNPDYRQTFFVGNANGYVTQYPTFSSFGINGGYYYGKISYTF